MAANTARGKAGAGQRGFSYLLVLLMVAVAGVGMAALGTVWASARQNDDEAQLLHIGQQYRQAIRSYYLTAPAPQRRYPASLDDLLKDPRSPGLLRHLRRPWLDPVSGMALVPVPAADGGIMGVRSASTARPRKTAGFDAADAAFEALAELRGDKLAYSDWEFVYLPPGPGVRP